MSYFLSNFCFQVISVLLLIVSLVLFLVTESVFLHAFLWNLRVFASMRQRCPQIWWVLFLLFFLKPKSLSTSSLRCKSLCIVISFLVLLSNCLSSLVNFKNGPEYLTRETAQVFIPRIRFLLYSFVQSSSTVLLRYSFLISLIFPSICKFCLFRVF